MFGVLMKLPDAHEAEETERPNVGSICSFKEMLNATVATAPQHFKKKSFIKVIFTVQIICIHFYLQ